MTSKDDILANPNANLPSQSTFTVSNNRSHLIDHYLDNGKLTQIPLTSWKYDFIAGELALDALDLPEAGKMFQMSLAEAKREPAAVAKGHQALSNVRLALIARKNGNLGEAERLYKESLPILTDNLDENDKAVDIALHELALIAWKQ